VTGRGKPPNNDFWASAAFEFVPKAKTPELDAPWVGSPNCGTAGFSGEVEEAPNLKVNEKPGFVSFGSSLCKIPGGLADSPGDWAEVDCSGVSGFKLSVELASPNLAKGVPDELSSENIGDVGPFCSELAVAGFGSIVVVVGVGWTFVESGVGL
jgi:hypothetical protein